jgi:FkbM family methyltransferase
MDRECQLIMAAPLGVEVGPAEQVRMPRKWMKRACHKARNILFRPAASPIRPGQIRLGTEYGGWVLRDTPNLRGCVALSCGAGEDISFDVEFASRYSAQVFIVDPTPRAVYHVDQVCQKIPAQPRALYSNSGRQPVDAYDTSTLRLESLVLLPYAISAMSGRLRLYAPPNPEHVSYSMSDYQSDYRRQGNFIDVQSRTLSEILNLLPAVPSILKLDIEGAQAEVLMDLLRSDWRPHQILMEFDELNFPTRRHYKAWRLLDRQLKEHRYVRSYFDGVANFLYEYQPRLAGG